MARSVTRRAQLLEATLPHGLKGKTLQEYVQAATKAPLKLDSTAFSSMKFGSLRINSPPKKSKGGGVLLKIVGHAPAEKATTVPLSLAKAKKEESSAKPPKQQSFKNSDFFLLIRGNYIMGLGDHMRIETAIAYLRQLLQNKLGNSKFAALDVSTVFKYDAAKKLSEGVRSIEFDATLSAATVQKLNDEKLRGPVNQLLHGLSQDISALVKKDLDPAALADVKVAVSISVRGGVHGSDSARSAIATTAVDLLNDDSLDDASPIQASIVTKGGNRVSIGNATVGANYKLQRRINENSVIDLEAWDALEDFDEHVRSLGPLKT